MMGMTGFNPAIDLLKIRNSAYTSNAGYALGNINRISGDENWTRSTINSSASLQWLKVYLGLATPEIVERAAAIRQEIAEAVADYVNANSYSNDLGMTNFLLKDLDVYLIRDALIQRFDKPLTWQSESMGDINALLDYNVYSGTTPYKFADIDTDGLVTGTQVTPEQITDYGYNLFNVQNPTFQSLSWTINSSNIGVITNTSATKYFTLYDRNNQGGQVYSSSDEGTYGFFMPQYQQVRAVDIAYITGSSTSTFEITLGPGESIDMQTMTTVPYPSIGLNIGVEEITSFASQSDGDVDHWIRLTEEGWDTFITSRYRALKNYAHQQYHLFKPLIYSKVYMSSQRIRTCQLEYPTGVPDVDDLPVVAVSKTSFTTDFKYIKKDPNGQFFAGGMDRCPAFAGSSSSGNIPDNLKLGGGYVEVNQTYSGYTGSTPAYNIPKESVFDSNEYWTFDAVIPEDIIVNPPNGDGTYTYIYTEDWNKTSFFTNTTSDFLVDYRAYNENGNNLLLAYSSMYSQPTRGYGASGVNLTSISTQYLTFSGNTIIILPNWARFVTYDSTKGYYISKGSVQLKVYKKDFYENRSVNFFGTQYGNMKQYVEYLDTQFGNMDDIRVAVGWNITGVYGYIPPTRFDFAETT